MTIGIYKITERETGRCYIGQSKDIEKRWKYHRGKYGKFPASVFDYEILITCDVAYLNFFEKAFIFGYDSHSAGFNKTIGGTDIKCTHTSEETKRKQSAALKGKPNPNKGKPKSEETKRKMSEAMTGKSHSEETRRKMSEARLGKPPGNKGRSQPKLQCPHCLGLFSAGPMARCHGDRCKKKVSTDTK